MKKSKLFIDDTIVVTSPQQLETLAEAEFDGIDYFFNLGDAQFYYEWGNEPAGCVSIGMYDKNEIYQSLGYAKKEDAKKYNLPYNCPFN